MHVVDSISAISDTDALQRIAERIVRNGLSVPVLLLVELCKPLTTLGHNMLLCGRPFLVPLIGQRECDRLSQFLRSRENIEQFLRILEKAQTESHERR